MGYTFTENYDKVFVTMWLSSIQGSASISSPNIKLNGVGLSSSNLIVGRAGTGYYVCEVVIENVVVGDVIAPSLTVSGSVNSWSFSMYAVAYND